MSMKAVRPGRGVAWQIAEPLVPDGVIKLSPSAPQVTHCSGVNGFGEFAT